MQLWTCEVKFSLSQKLICFSATLNVWSSIFTVLYPTDTRCNNNVNITSLDVIMTLLLRYVSAGLFCCCSSDLTTLNTTLSWTNACMRFLCIKGNQSMGWCKKCVTPLLMHWRYVFVALTHRPVLQFCVCKPKEADLNLLPYFSLYPHLGWLVSVVYLASRSQITWLGASWHKNAISQAY